MYSSKTLSVIDYVLFGLTLAVSSAIGIYHAIKARRSPQTNADAEFLMGSRKMPVLPTAISLVTSVVSGISYLAYPAEMYTMGTAFAWQLLGAVLGISFVAAFIVPTLHSVKSVSIYKYLGDRFESTLLHKYASLCFLISTSAYMAAALYASAVALSSSIGAPTWIFILAVGAVTTFYTSIGGLKAVVWTDAFQAVVMYGGSLALMIKAIIAAGGWSQVWQFAEAGGRLGGARNIDPNPAQYMTVWTALIGGFFYFMNYFASSQTALQRYCSTSSVRKGQMVALWNVPGLVVVQLMVFFTGIIMFAFYAFCDPLKRPDNPLQTRDQLVMTFVLDVLGDAAGLPGLFLCCLLSATLSTLSGGINSMAAVTSEDFIKPFSKRFRNSTSAALSKTIAVAYGIAATALAFLAEPLGGILQACVSALGTFQGPVSGLILLGIFFPKVRAKAAIAGAVSGSALSLWAFIGHTLLRSDAKFALPTSICGCANNSTYSNLPITPIAMNYSMTSTDDISCLQDLRQLAEDHFAKRVSFDGLDNFYAISFLMYACIGTLTTVGVALIVSLASALVNRRQDDMDNKNTEAAFL